jgi:hypothetical protein
LKKKITGEIKNKLKRGHPTLQNMNFKKKNSTFVRHFCPPGSGSGSTDPIESGSNTDPQPCLQLHLVEAAGQLHRLGQWLAGEAGLDQDQIRHS